jgi:hypothetical protein
MTEAPHPSSDRPILWGSRLRLLQFGLAAAILLAAAQVLDPPFYLSWWFWVGLSTAASTVFAEPNFTPPRAAVTNAVGAIAIYFTATRTGVEQVWNLYLALAIAVLVAAFLVLSGESFRDRPILGWVTTRIGKARVFGIGALLIESLRTAPSAQGDAAAMFLVTIALLAVIGLDWTRFVVPAGRRASYAVFEAAVDPNLLLFSSASKLEPGHRVTVERGSRQLTGYVVGSLAHKRAGRYQVVLDEDWRSVLPTAGAECLITPSDADDDTVGFVIEGTDELVARFHPLTEIRHGEAVAITGPDGLVLFQVTSLKLDKDRWDEAAGLQARATAAQVGAAANGQLALRPWLPKPFQAVTRPAQLTGNLPDGHALVGHVSGTQIPIGVKESWDANDGHVGILGMSGMGKTNAAQLLSRAFGADTLFLVLDGTGEYRAKLAWPSMPDNGWSTPGAWVYEPAGLPALRCKETINALMTAASTEFQAGTPSRRVLLVEEAHSFLPEWTFATKSESDSVNASARFILQARKFGLSFVFVSQRTAVISKSALSQCENFLIFRTIDATSLDFIESVVGSEFRPAVAGLQRYQALCVGPIFNTEAPVIMDLKSSEL